MSVEKNSKKTNVDATSGHAPKVMIVAGFTMQVCVLSWHISVPSHKLPFSSGAQSAVFWHWQVLAPPTQTPAAHASP